MRKRFFSILGCILMLFSTAHAGLQSYGGGEYQYILFGHCPSGSGASLLWRVLTVEEDNILLLSEYVIDARAAHSDTGSFSGYENSDIYRYVKEELPFLAFSDEERTAFFCDDPIDLPSPDLLKNKELGLGTDKLRLTYATEYAAAKGASSPANYWMNTASQSSKTALRRVLADGVMGYSSVTAVSGIRPTLRLNKDIISINKGSGSKEDPFILNATQEALEKLQKQQQIEAALQQIEKGKQAFADKLAQTKSDLERMLAAKAVKDAKEALALAKKEGADSDKISALEEELKQKEEALKSLVSLEIEGFPLLTPEGFLPKGSEEFVSIDAENGEWRYCSEDLRIEIKKHEGIFDEKKPNRPTRYFVAEIRVPKGVQPFRTYPFAENRTVNRDAFKAKQSDIARQHNLVLAFGADYYIYRTGRPGVRTGVEIRDGEILFDDPPTRTKLTYPPLDMMALYPNGDMKVFEQSEVTAAELVFSGVTDVFTFGPVLIRDGEVNMSYENFGYNPEPRVQIGMVEPGHYYLLVVEGRTKVSRGIKCRDGAFILKELGCETAFNLDGGWTSSVIFMGQQLNQLDNNGVHNNARTQNEVIGVGLTPNIQKYLNE